MRHRKKRLDINRFTSWRKATLKSMAANLFIHQSIRTTCAKAKAVRPLVEKLVSLAKVNTLFAKRRAFIMLGDHKLVSVLFSEIGPRFVNRVGGYTRIIKIGSRRGDNAEVVIFELTEIKKKEPKKLKEKIVEEKEHQENTAIKEKPPIVKKPAKKFLGGIKSIFKKKSDSL